MIKALVKVWTGYQGKNLVMYGDFENPSFFAGLPTQFKVQLSQEYAFNGKRSLFLKPNKLTQLKDVRIIPGKSYCFSFRMFLPRAVNTGKITFYLIPFSTPNNQNFRWWFYECNDRQAGQWIYYTIPFQAPESKIYNLQADALRIRFHSQNMVHTALFYVDDVRLVCLDDIPLK